MRVAAVLLIACLLVPTVAAERVLYFEGDGSSDVGSSSGSNNYPIKEDSMGSATSFTTVLGNNLENNPWLPTYTWNTAPLYLTPDDELTVYHYAAVTGEPAGCGIIGTLYGPGGAILKSQTVAAPSTDVSEFIFTFSGLDGKYDSLQFQPVQSANQCGWATIEHHWGASATPGRMLVPETAFFPPSEDLEVVEIVNETAVTIYENLTSLEVHHNFTNETTATYVFNLTTFAPNGTLDALVNGTGMVNATLADGNGTMIFNGTLGNGTVDLVGVETGNWTLTLVYEAFNGTVDIVYTQTVGGVPVEAADLDGSGDATVADEDAPGLPIVLLMVALVALARRRS